MSWAGPHREEGAERLLDGAASRWSQPQLGFGGCNQRFLKSYRDEQTDTAASGQEEIAVGREWSSERGDKRRGRGLEPADVRHHQVPGKRVLCTESGLNTTHRSAVRPSEQAAQGHWGIRANPG